MRKVVRKGNNVHGKDGVKVANTRVNGVNLIRRKRDYLQLYQPSDVDNKAALEKAKPADRADTVQNLYTRKQVRIEMIIEHKFVVCIPASIFETQWLHRGPDRV